MPLLTFDDTVRDVNGVHPLEPPPSYAAAHDDEEEKDAPPRRWYHYLPTCGAFISICSEGQRVADYMPYFSSLEPLINCACSQFVCPVTIFCLLAVHPSLLTVLVNYHLRVLHAPIRFLVHLVATYTLTLLAFASLIVIIVRDPGRVGSGRARGTATAGAEGEDMNLTEALLSTDDLSDINSPGKWCRKCWAPKPERTHQCVFKFLRFGTE